MLLFGSRTPKVGLMNDAMAGWRIDTDACKQRAGALFKIGPSQDKHETCVNAEFSRPFANL